MQTLGHMSANPDHQMRANQRTTASLVRATTRTCDLSCVPAIMAAISSPSLMRLVCTSSRRSASTCGTGTNRVAANPGGLCRWGDHLISIYSHSGHGLQAMSNFGQRRGCGIVFMCHVIWFVMKRVTPLPPKWTPQFWGSRGPRKGFGWKLNETQVSCCSYISSYVVNILEWHPALTMILMTMLLLFFQ